MVQPAFWSPQLAVYVRKKHLNGQDSATGAPSAFVAVSKLSSSVSEESSVISEDASHANAVPVNSSIAPEPFQSSATGPASSSNPMPQKIGL